MVEFITWIYLFYMFIALYFLILFTLTFIQNRKEMFDYPKLTKDYSVSVLIPAYNEEDSIEGTVKSILDLDYKNVEEIIIINDGSKDKTKEIASMLEKKYGKVILFDKTNSGKADSLNQAIKLARGELIAVVDADSYPKSDAVIKMIGYFEDENIGAVTSRVLVRNKNNWLSRFQIMDYSIIAWTRKLLDFVDSVYVTNGPLSIYRKSIVEEVGGFDTKNLTEDIEITWNILSRGYNTRMSYDAIVYTNVPEKLKTWINQRVRWNLGGIQTLRKYYKVMFKRGAFGY